VPKRLHIATK